MENIETQLAVNDELNLDALPAQERDGLRAREYEPAQGAVETLLATIWAEVLQVEPVGRRDNFFELGGRSLLATQVAARWRKALGVEVGIRDVFEHPVLEDFARIVASATPTVQPPIRRAEPRQDSVPLSLAQQRLWFLAQMEGGSKAYNIPLTLRLRGRLDRNALKRALNRIVARHEALRTTFVTVDGEPQQRIAKVKESGFHLLDHDLRQDRDQEGELQRLTADEAGAEFDLETGPVIRGRLIQLDEEDHALLISMHHIVSDGWSLEVLFRELSTLYGAYVRGEEEALPELEVQYADYALWQRKWLEGAALEQQAEYWRMNLEGAPELLELPTDRVCPALRDFAGAALPVRLNGRLTAGLKELSARQGTTLYMTLLAAWAVLLGRLSGQQDVVIGSPVANRGRVEIEGLIGFFVNMVAMRLNFSGGSTVREVLARTSKQTVAAQQHQDIPFDQVVEIVQPVRSLAHSPVFQVTFTWMEQFDERPKLSGLETTSLESSPHLVSKFDMALMLEESGGLITGLLEYATTLFDSGTVERYVEYFTRLLEGMVAGENERVDRLPLLGEEERRQVVEDWNQTEAEIPLGCVHELFEEQVERQPDAVALESGEEAVSYGQLNRRANRLAHYLLRCGVRAETRVGLCLERSVEMVVAMLGILKAGGVYVPLDVEYPAERLLGMIEDAEVGAVVTKKGFEERLPVEATQFLPVVLVDGIGEESEENGCWEADARQLAYVMYTSGSTGWPKGVMVTHGNVVRLVRNTNYAEFGPQLVLGHISSVMFDALTLEAWGALLNGGRVVVAEAGVLSLEEIAKVVKEHGVNMLWLTAPLFHAMVEERKEDLEGVRQLLAGGDVLSPGHVAEYLKSVDGRKIGSEIGTESGREKERWLINGYGPTEVTTFTCCHRMREVEEGLRSVPIGRPIGNTQVYVVDGEMELVGKGVPGEICAGGLGLARGYGNNAGLTAERFVPNPYGRAGERMYRTGDIGRWRGEGTVEFVGRRDAQVKIRGYRIELGEVERALREQAEVKDAVVVARVKESGDKQLVGYVVGKRGVELKAAEVREGLRNRLPEYMIPVVVVLEELPLNANGKVERRKLPAPEEVLGRRCGGEYQGPRDQVEALLAEVWTEALGLERVGVEDNFFELGGDSILCVRIIGRARERGLEFSLQDLFEHQTIAALAKVARRVAGEERLDTAPFELVGEEIRSRLAEDIEDAYPLSRLQAGMLFHSGYAPESGVYHDVISYRVHLAYQAETLAKVVDGLTARHAMLRTSIDMRSFSEPLQLVHRQAKLRVIEEDWRLKTSAEHEAELAQFMEREFRVGFRWDEAPHLRIFAHWLREDAFQCTLSFHHAIMDGWSEASLITQLVQDYKRALAGQPLETKPMAVQYRDYIALEQRAMESEASLAFWKQLLEGLTVTPVPLRDWREEEKSGKPGELARTIKVSEAIRKELQKLARELGTPLKTVLLAAHMKALQVLTGEPDVTTGVALNGRPEMEGGERMVGLFLNTVPFRLRVDSSSWRSLIEQTFAVEKRVVEHRRYPMVDLRMQIGGQALYKTTFNYVHFHVYNEAEAETQTLVEERKACTQTSLDFFVNFEVSATTGSLVGTVRSDTGVMSAAALERIAAYYERILAGMVEDRIHDLQPDEEQVQIQEWNRTEEQIPGGPVSELFEEQVRRTPDAIAVVDAECALSYSELNAQANRLAHFLMKCGAGRETRVGILLERSAELVVAMLAVLKAGGAYVPLDLDYSPEQLTSIIEDGGAGLLITKIGTGDRLPGQAAQFVPVVRVDGDREVIVQESKENPGLEIDARQLASVIYTSGSMGQPKGVEIEHQQIKRLTGKRGLVPWKQDDVMLQTASTSFDAASFEIWGALLCGLKLVLGPAGMVSVEQLAATIVKEEVTVLGLSAALFNQIVDERKQELAGVRYLVTGGDVLSRQHVKTYFENATPKWLLNTYGPTEASTFACCYPMSGFDDASRSVSIGQATANTQVHIFDQEMNDVGIGVPGEICLAGFGLGRGYRNQPGISAERYVPNPLGAAGERMFRTGDLGRWGEHGTIEYLGRIDEQVKIRGYRIQLGDIAARLEQHAGVAEAVVVAREGLAGEQRLLAYYTEPRTCKADPGRISAEELRDCLTLSLPDHMVPAGYVRLERLPLTISGKVDRKALPAPEDEAFAVRSYEPPEGDIETVLAGIWAEVLQVERVGRHDNFFALGGRSLPAVQVAARVQQRLNVELNVRDIFERPTLSLLADQIVSLKLSTFNSNELVQLFNEIQP